MPPDADVSARDALLAAFLADPPPRRVPPELKRAAGRQGPSWFFGGFGLLFGGFGLFFAWMFFPWNIYRGWQLADAPTAPGRITAVSATGLRENKQRVYRYDFDFSPPAGGRVEGTCYTTGQRWNAGAPVTVRYKPDDPAWCCIEGARTSVGSALSALVLLFPAIGGSLVAWVVLARRRLSFLLEHGQVGEARVTAVDATSTQINNQRVYRITLQRLEPAGSAPLAVRKYEPAQVALARERLASNQPVFVLYDPARPQRLLLAEALR